MRIDFHPSATAELGASADWYASRSPAAARGFVLGIDAAIKKIERDPNRFQRIDTCVTKCVVLTDTRFRLFFAMTEAESL